MSTQLISHPASGFDLENLEQVDRFFVVLFVAGARSCFGFTVFSLGLRDGARHMRSVSCPLGDSSIRAAIGPGDDSIFVDLVVFHLSFYSSDATMRLRAKVTHYELAVQAS